MKCFLGLMMSSESHLHQIMIDDFLSYLLHTLAWGISWEPQLGDPKGWGVESRREKRRRGVCKIVSRYEI